MPSEASVLADDLARVLAGDEALGYHGEQEEGEHQDARGHEQHAAPVVHRPGEGTPVEVAGPFEAVLQGVIQLAVASRSP